MKRRGWILVGLLGAAALGLASSVERAGAPARPGPAYPWTGEQLVEHEGGGTLPHDAASPKGGADHIVAGQNLDGGWGWEHGGPSAGNTVGPIAMGVVNSYRFTADASHLASATLAGDFAVAYTYSNGEPRFGTFTPYFLWRLTAAGGVSTYADHAATSFFGALAAGTYGPSDYDTAGWIASVQAARAGDYVNLRPWEFMTLVETAAALGTSAQRDLFLQGVEDGIETLDTSKWWDILGLAGGVYGLAANGVDFDPLLGPYAAASTTADLADDLAGLQNTDGSWYWSSTLSAPAEDDKDTQTTAYALLALAAADDDGRFAGAIQRGRAWLWGMMTLAGGTPSYPGGTENYEVEGEALWSNEPMSGPLDMYANALSNARVVVHPEGPWFEVMGARVSDTEDWGLAGILSDMNQFSIYVPEFGPVWNAPWETGTIHNFSDWERYGMQLSFGPGHVLNDVIRFPFGGAGATDTGIDADWTLSYYNTPRATPLLDATTIWHTILYGSVRSWAADLTGELGASGSTIRLTGMLVNDADEGGATGSLAENEKYEYFGFGDHPDEASSDGDYIASSDVAGYRFDFTVVYDSTDIDGNHVYKFPTPAAGGPAALSLPAASSNSLLLDVADACVKPGDTVTVTLWQNTMLEAVRGYQAFLHFDTSMLAHVATALLTPEGSPPPDYWPYGLEILNQVTAGDIDVAAGIDDLNGQSPTGDDAPLAEITFTAGTTEGTTTVGFRASSPPSRFTGVTGGAVAPSLVNAPTITIDGTPPSVSIDSIRQSGGDVDCAGLEAVQGTVEISVTVTDPNFSGFPDVDVSGPSTLTDTFVSRTGDTYVYRVGIDAATPCGCYTVTATAQDCAGNVTVATDSFEAVKGTLVADVELEGAAAGPFDRCITFVLYDTTSCVTYETSSVVTFTGGLGTASLENIPCEGEAFDCITAQDELHTLRKKVTNIVDLGNNQYSATFTGSDKLVGGNLNNDEFVDILDFGIFSYQFGTAPGADTSCSTAGPHADINGDGAVSTPDFTFILGNFVEPSDPVCCGSFAEDGARPIVRISVKELIHRGMPELAAGDINGDGWLDRLDMLLFLNGAQPPRDSDVNDR